MIKLYYTGALENGAEQKEIHKSLGGYISGTQIPNGRKNNLFRDISYYTKVKNENEIICIAAKNITDTQLQDVTLYANVPEGYKLLAAIVTPNISSCGAPIFEELKTQRDLPYYAEFNDITSQQNEILIGTIEPQSYIGIFLQRLKSADTQNISECDNVEELAQSTNSIKNIELNFNWA